MTMKTTLAGHTPLLFVPWMNISGDASEILAHLFVNLRTAAACLHVTVTAPGPSKAIADIQSRHACQLIAPANDRIRSPATWLAARKWSAQTCTVQTNKLGT